MSGVVLSAMKCLPTIVFLLFGLVALFSALPTDATAAVTVIQVDDLMPAPAWALKQRQLLAMSAEVTKLVDELCFTKEGYFKGTYVHGGGHLAPDDVFEFGGKGPLLYALGADQFVLDQWWRIYQASLRQCGPEGNKIFANDMCKYLDWHHNAEHYQSFWTAALCMPENSRYRSLLLKYASFYDGSNPQVPNYDPQRKVIRSMLSGGAGPIRQAKRADWDAKEAAFWDDWLACGHDGPVNLVTTNWGTLAYMLTGDERRKQTTLGYINAWRELIAISIPVTPLNLAVNPPFVNILPDCPSDLLASTHYDSVA